MNQLQHYLETTPKAHYSLDTIAYLSNLEKVKEVSPTIAKHIQQELQDQRRNLKLIASENFTSLSVQAAMGNLLTDKYAEGFPRNRFYAGCDNVDHIEQEAADLACELFDADYAYVQPHSGVDANQVAFLSILMERIQKPFFDALGKEVNINNATPEQFAKLRDIYGKAKLMALDLYSGGHLTHGYRMNNSALMFDVHPYSVDPVTHLLDLDQIRAQAKAVKPTILLAGYSAYSRHINFAHMREIADEVGAVFMVDMAHFAGLVAGKAFTGDHNPVPFAHVLTTTTHKTLRGPRGGMILATEQFQPFIDKGCPSFLGGPLPHVMAAKAIALREALTPDYRAYAHKIIENSQAMAQAFIEKGATLVTGGTDNHLMLLDVTQSYGLTGRQAEHVVRAAGITLNRNGLPFDSNGPWYTSGLRIGTPATTTLGMGVKEMQEIADIIHTTLAATTPGITDRGTPSKANYDVPDSVLQQGRERAQSLLDAFPLYPTIQA